MPDDEISFALTNSPNTNNSVLSDHTGSTGSGTGFIQRDHQVGSTTSSGNSSGLHQYTLHPSLRHHLMTSSMLQTTSPGTRGRGMSLGFSMPMIELDEQENEDM